MSITFLYYNKIMIFSFRNHIQNPSTNLVYWESIYKLVVSGLKLSREDCNHPLGILCEFEKATFLPTLLSFSK